MMKDDGEANISHDNYCSVTEKEREREIKLLDETYKTIMEIFNYYIQFHFWHLAP